MERLHPGVYVEEISSGVRPIEGVSTSTAAFVGVAARGVPSRAQLVTSYDDFARSFGGFLPGEDGFLPLAVDAFFSGGGRRAYVVRVLPADANVAVQETAQPTRFTPAGGGTPAPALRFSARGAGAWASFLRIHLADASNFPDEAFRVEVQWIENGRTRTLEVFDDLRMDPDREEYFASIINERSDYIRVTDELQRALDADDGTITPIPAQVPRLQARDLATAADRYIVHEGATLAFTWTAGGAQARTQRITFEGGGLPFADGTASLTRAELFNFLTAAFGAFPGGAILRATQGAGSDGPFVEPSVATRGRLAIDAPAGAAHDLTGETLHVTVGAGPAIDIVVADEVADDSAVSPAELAELLARRLGPDNLVDLVDDEVIVRTRAVADGAAPSVTQTPDTNSLAVTATAGAAGLEVESLDGLALTVSEEPNRHFPRTVRDLGFPSRSLGYEQDAPANPIARPRATTDAIRLVGGTDGTGRPGVTDYQRALSAFDRVDVNLVALPGRNSAAFINAGLTYCDNRGDCFFLADGPGHIDADLAVEPQDARSFIDALPNRSKNGAMFYPWVRVPDPVGAGRNPTRFVPPSGHIAGIFARTDITRGVWKAPAGIEAVVAGALGLQYDVIDAEQDTLNPAGLNAIRQFPGTGIVSWGSRTLSSDPEWRYVPVRRTALFLKTSLQRGLQWAVFEPNDAELWDRIRINITSFMLGLFRQGAFQGSTPDEAFTVTCDRSTNPQELIDAGIVTARVAFAPLKPAEFVVIEIVQKTLIGS